MPLTTPFRVGDENTTCPVVPLSLRVGQSSTAVSVDVSMVPELVVESDASGGSASVRAPTGTRVIAIGPALEIGTGEVAIVTHEKVPA
jgi:hypothetical protein